jgi:hypothetical protein
MASWRLSTAAAPFLAMLIALGPSLGALGADSEDQTSAKVWKGTWSNRKYKTTGPLKCTASRKDDQSAEATFEGTFMGDPFRYTIDVNTRRQRDRTLVDGTAQLDGDKYEWSGYVRGKVFYGEYRSLKGNNGEFRLEEAEK